MTVVLWRAVVPPQCVVRRTQSVDRAGRGVKQIGGGRCVRAGSVRGVTMRAGDLGEGETARVR